MKYSNYKFSSAKSSPTGFYITLSKNVSILLAFFVWFIFLACVVLFMLPHHSYAQATDSTIIGQSPGVTQVVTDISYDLGEGTWHEACEYEQASQYYEANDVRDRRFAAFGQVTKTTDLGSTIPITTKAMAITCRWRWGDSEARIGLPFLSEVYE